MLLFNILLSAACCVALQCAGSSEAIQDARIRVVARLAKLKFLVLHLSKLIPADDLDSQLKHFDIADSNTYVRQVVDSFTQKPLEENLSITEIVRRYFEQDEISRDFYFEIVVKGASEEYHNILCGRANVASRTLDLVENYVNDLDQCLHNDVDPARCNNDAYWKLYAAARPLGFVLGPFHYPQKHSKNRT